MTWSGDKKNMDGQKGKRWTPKLSFHWKVYKINVFLGRRGRNGKRGTLKQSFDF